VSASLSRANRNFAASAAAYLRSDRLIATGRGDQHCVTQSNEVIRCSKEKAKVEKGVVLLVKAIEMGYDRGGAKEGGVRASGARGHWPS
jgi:hypothetical protein